MNKDNAKGYLPLVQALADGKVIQFRCTENHPWQDGKDVDFSLPRSYYRIKPEPRVLYVLLGHVGTRWGSSFNESEAKEWAKRHCGHDGKVRKFVEVVED